MPLGLPVVPDEYSIAAPELSSAIGVAGNAATASSRFRTRSPSPGPSTTRHRSTPGAMAMALSATSRLACEVINTRDRLLVRI